MVNKILKTKVSRSNVTIKIKQSLPSCYPLIVTRDPEFPLEFFSTKFTEDLSVS